MSGSLRRRAFYALATNDTLESAARSNRVTEDLAYRAAKRYVAGRTLDEAIDTVRRLVGEGLGVSLDLFGEGVDDERQLREIVAGYREAAAALHDVPGDVGLEIVPSHLGLDLGIDTCRRHVEEIVPLLRPGTLLQISAEESHRTPHIMNLALAMAADGAPVQATVQANLRRSPDDVDRLITAGIPVRLVKGAYLEAPEAAFSWGEQTDLAYIRLAHQVHSGGAGLAIATHDRVVREALLTALPGTSVEMLLGVREDDARELAAGGHQVRIYAPYGGAWFRYWMRRVTEAQGT
jgi:proline dehydrogenase